MKRKDSKPVSDPESLVICKRFAWETSIHGIKYISRTNYVRSTVWLLLIAASCTGLCIQVRQKLILWYETPIVTNMDIQFPFSMHFPAVVFCNLNQYRLSAASKDLYELLTTIDAGKPYNISDYRQNFARLDANMDSLDYLNEAAHKKENMFLSCTLPNGETCTAANFTSVATDFGICYQLNGHKPYLISDKDGADNGIRVLMNLEAYDHIEGVKDTVGMKILVYPHRALPFVRQKGIDIPPGFMSELPITVVEYELVPKTQGGNCVTKTPLKNYYDDGGDRGYSTELCRMDRIVSSVRNNCNCLPYYAPLPPPILYNTAKPDPSLQRCSPMSHFGCVLMNSALEREDDNCPLNCSATDYKLAFSLSQLPGNVMREAIGERAVVDTALDVAMEARSRNQKDWIVEFDALMDKLVAANYVLTMAYLIPDISTYITTYDRLVHLVPCFQNFTSAYRELMRVDPFEKTYWYSIPTWRMAEILYPQQYFSICDVNERKQFLLRMEPDLLKWLRPAWDMLEVAKELMDFFQSNQYKTELTRSLTDHVIAFELIDKYKLATNYTKFDFATEFTTKLSNYGAEYNQQFIAKIVGNLNSVTERIKKYWTGEQKGRRDNRWLIKILNNTNDGNETLLALAETISFGEPYDCQPSDELGDNVPKSTCGRTTPCPYKLFDNNPNLDNVELRTVLEQGISCITGDLLPTAQQLYVNLTAVTKNFTDAHRNLERHFAKYLEEFKWPQRDAFFRENIVGVNIYFRELRKDIMKQVMVYDVWSLACDFGGTLGLFLGASLLSLVELVDLVLFRCLWYRKVKPVLDASVTATSANNYTEQERKYSTQNKLRRW